MMNREEAITYLKEWRKDEYEINDTDKIVIDMAIDALSADRPKGEWIDKGEYAECSICGAHSGKQFDGVEPIPLKTPYCPSCGADMRGEK